MKITSKPVEKTYKIASDPDGTLEVTIRQASFGETTKLRELSSQSRIVDSGEDSVAVEQDVNQNDIKAKSIFLTLSNVDGIFDEENQPIDPLDFVDDGGYRRIRSEVGFMKVINFWPDAVIDEIYEKVLEVNVNWDNRRNKEGE